MSDRPTSTRLRSNTPNGLRAVLSLAAALAAWNAAPSEAWGQTPAPEPNPRARADTAVVDFDSTRVFELEPLTVRGRIDDLTGTVGSASVGYIGSRDLLLRPLTREAELLETVPGMILTQHSGSGKSNQMFVRGFNLDHGTDFSTRIEGMPVNIPSHAHGQGYTDLNFIVPEFVDHIEYSLGSYYPEIGDFSSAGGAEFRLRRRLDGPLFSAGFGENGFRRVVAATPIRAGNRGSLLVGGEFKGYDGPWERAEDLNKVSGMARYTWQGAASSLSVLALGYQNGWNASDQIPQRGIETGLVGRFGQIDPTLGGATSRYSLSAAWQRATGASSQKVDVYAIHYDLDLFSNFTYLLDDAAAGDQIRQRDDGRWTLGANLTHSQPLDLLGTAHSLKVGAQARADEAHVSLSRTSERRTVSVVRDDQVSQWSTGIFGALETSWSTRFRTTLGVRADVHGFDVAARRPANSGSARDAMVSPKVSLAYEPWTGTELYASGGAAYHSNDARGTVQTVDPESGMATQAVDPLVRSLGAELGLRSTPVRGLRTTLSLWTVGLDSELLFVGDAGRTEPSDGSRRVGVTWANFYRMGPHWIADLDLSFTRARFSERRAGMRRIPGALENVVAAGLSYEPSEDGVFGALRLRRFGAYPLTEDNSQRSNATALLNLNLGYRLGDARLTVSLLNVLNGEHSDIQYFYESRLRGEPLGGVADLHLHPAEPRQIRMGVTWGL